MKSVTVTRPKVQKTQKKSGCGCGKKNKKKSSSTPQVIKGEKRKLILQHKLCVGDILAFTVCFKSLHEQFPDKFILGVDCPHPSIFLHNPYVTDNVDGEVIKVKYDAINRSTQSNISMTGAFVEHLSNTLLGKGYIDKPLFNSCNAPDIYFDEKNEVNPLRKHAQLVADRKNYVVFNCGSKGDFPVKQIDPVYIQELINASPLTFVQVGKTEHSPVILDNCINMVGKTPNFRDLMLLIKDSKAVVSGMSSFHWLAAGCGVTNFLIQSREPLQWCCGPKTHMLHSIGQLSCNRNSACWKNKIEKCENFVHRGGNIRIPACHCSQYLPPVSYLANVISRL